VPDDARGGARAERQQGTEALTGAELVQRPQQGVAVAEAQPRRVQQAALGGLHRPGDGAAGRDGVDAELVAPGAGGQDRIGVGHPAQRPERADALVLHPHRGAASRLVQVLAADRARGAGGPRHAPRLRQLLRSEPLGAVEGRRGEVAGRQRRQGVEGQDVAHRPELPVALGRPPQRPGPQVAGCLEHPVDVGRGGPVRTAHGARLDPLAAQDRPQTAAPRVPAVVRDRGVRDPPLAGGPDRRDLPAMALPVAQRLLGVGRRPAPQVTSRLQPHVTVLDQQHRRPGGPADQHDGVVAGQLPGDREVAAGQGVGEQSGQRRLGDDGELRAGGQGGADQGGEHEAQRGLGGERFDAGRSELGEQPGAQAHPAEVLPQHRGRDGQRAAAPVGDVDDQGPAEAAARRGLTHRRLPTGRRRRPRRPAGRAGRARWRRR